MNSFGFQLFVDRVGEMCSDIYGMNENVGNGKEIGGDSLVVLSGNS